MEIATNGVDRIRSFVGVGLPDAHRESLGAYLETCRSLAPGLRWVAPAGLHLTLRFLGSVEAPLLERLAGELRGLPVASFQVRLGGVGSFGRGSAVRVVWAGVADGEDGLRALAARVEERCRAVGLAPEERPYNPHLTLARAKDRRGSRVPELPLPPELPGWTVDRFRLYRSQPARGGAVHTVLEEFAAG